ncbi:MAG: hypothetical protein GY863_20785 [bacterium]|nr:hypothetical protein [bacterium]
MARYFPSDSNPSGLDLFSLLKKRRSVREFKQESFPYSKIEAVIAAGQHSPSGGNRHPWHFVVVSDPEKKKIIRDRCEKADKSWHENADDRLRKWLKAKHITPVKNFLTDAPYLIVVFADKNDPYWKESTWISIGYMMLAVVDQGLGTVIYTPGDGSFLNEFLDVAEHYIPQVILPVGIPVIEPQANPKRQTEKEYLYRKNLKDNSKVSDTMSREDKTENSNNGMNKNGDRKCACGCGKPLIGLNQKRKYIHGHSKFGENGIFKILKSPPKCKCGCSKGTEWDWDRMTWKKYIDSHIGVRKNNSGQRNKLKKQFDLFEKK